MISQFTSPNHLNFMGATVSGLLCADCDDKNTSGKLPCGLGDVPESCVSTIFMYLDPPEICRLACLNRVFNCASSADFVWETKLPSNYRFLVETVLHQTSHLGKKEIYARLSTPSFFDDGNKQIWLDKISGKICISVSYKALRITGIDDRRYWTHIASDESRYQAVAYLKQIWWFEVTGELEFEYPPGTYSIFYKLQLGKPCRRFGKRSCNLAQVHGWNIKPVRFQLSTSNGQSSSAECFLYEPGDWHYYHVGDFVVDSLNSPMKINFSMMQIDCTHTKGGLCLDSVFIYPIELREKIKALAS